MTFGHYTFPKNCGRSFKLEMKPGPSNKHWQSNFSFWRFAMSNGVCRARIRNSWHIFAWVPAWKKSGAVSTFPNSISWVGGREGGVFDFYWNQISWVGRGGGEAKCGEGLLQSRFSSLVGENIEHLINPPQLLSHSVNSESNDELWNQRFNWWAEWTRHTYDKSIQVLF